MKSIAKFIYFSILLSGLSHSAVIRTKTAHISSRYKVPKNSNLSLSEKVHPSRYLKEEKFLLGLTAKQKLFINHQIDLPKTNKNKIRKSLLPSSITLFV